ncbi:MAG: terminase family protein [Gammaproteobacteria bacterium]|nr:terminase family protein [Gammaproteobacteria bacterium]
MMTWPQSSVSRASAAAELLRRRRARLNLTDFSCYTYPAYVPEPAHRLIAAYLERVERGAVARLMIVAPPQHGKSELASVRFTAWVLGRHPQWPFILTSYAADLALDKSRQARQVVESGAYSRLFPGCSTAGDSRAVDHWRIAGEPGGLKAAGVGGPITGFGAMVGLIDDPVKNAEEAASATYRQKAKSWYETVFQTRLWEHSRQVLIMTRWHEDDLAGWLLRTQKGQWTVLRLPALAETDDERAQANARLGTTDTADPLARAPGEALCPGRFSRATLEARRDTMSPAAWAALYQGVPAPPTGAIFKRDWWQEGRRYHDADLGRRTQVVARYLSYDTAEGKSDTGGARTSCVVGELMQDYRLHVRHVRTGRPDFPELTAQVGWIAQHWNADGRLRGVLIEDKSSGVQVLQTLRHAAPEWLQNLLIPITPRVSKATRGEQAAVWCQNGCVWFPWPAPEVSWLYDFETELFDFPAGELCDQVDAFTQLVLYLEHYLAQGWHARGGL